MSDTQGMEVREYEETAHGLNTALAAARAEFDRKAAEIDAKWMQLSARFWKERGIHVGQIIQAKVGFAGRAENVEVVSYTHIPSYGSKVRTDRQVGLLVHPVTKAPEYRKARNRKAFTVASYEVGF